MAFQESICSEKLIKYFICVNIIYSLKDIPAHESDSYILPILHLICFIFEFVETDKLVNRRLLKCYLHMRRYSAYVILCIVHVCIPATFLE